MCLPFALATALLFIGSLPSTRREKQAIGQPGKVDVLLTWPKHISLSLSWQAGFQRTCVGREVWEHRDWRLRAEDAETGISGWRAVCAEERQSLWALGECKWDSQRMFAVAVEKPVEAFNSNGSFLCIILNVFLFCLQNLVFLIYISDFCSPVRQSWFNHLPWAEGLSPLVKFPPWKREVLTSLLHCWGKSYVMPFPCNPSSEEAWAERSLGFTNQAAWPNECAPRPSERTCLKTQGEWLLGNKTWNWPLASIYLFPSNKLPPTPTHK